MDQLTTEGGEPLIRQRNMADSTSTRCLSTTEGYRLWSQVYDSEPNPMLLLEQRFLEPLLPPVVGRDVVDLGCGTGRWLEKLALLKPRSLIGIDSSAHMLARAVGKVRGSATLLREDCGSCFDRLPRT